MRIPAARTTMCTVRPGLNRSGYLCEPCGMCAHHRKRCRNLRWRHSRPHGVGLLTLRRVLPVILSDMVVKATTLHVILLASTGMGMAPASTQEQPEQARAVQPSHVYTPLGGGRAA